MDVIDEAPDLFDALASAKALRPDVIIMNDYECLGSYSFWLSVTGLSHT